MRLFIYILFAIGGFMILPHAQAQQSEPRSPRLTRSEGKQPVKETKSQEVSVRALNHSKAYSKVIDEARWKRVIYRELDLSKEVNASIYYPARPTKEARNLFSIIFELISQGKINAYEYMDGYESFDENDRLDFQYILDNFHIYYDSTSHAGGSGRVEYVVNDSDIPSDLVQKYFVKEVYYFDQRSSTFGVLPLAICPILIESSDYAEGVNQQIPMFWIDYEELRPYITHTFVMTSSRNNAKNYSLDDFFSRQIYQGEIVKTENPLNLPLQALYNDPDSLGLARKRIEQELVDFEKSLWLQPDSIRPYTGKGKGCGGKAKPIPKAKKVKANTKATPSKSVRSR